MALQQAIKVTLSTGKVVILKVPKIADRESAAVEVAQRAGDSQMLFAYLMAKTMLKNLLLRVNDKEPSLTEKENMDGLFDSKEYDELSMAMGKFMGVSDPMKPTLEVVSFGE